MKHFIHKLSQLNFGNDFVFLVQILCILCLIYFSWKSLWFIYNDISEEVYSKENDKDYKKHFKGFPALAIIYLFFSFCFILSFILSFDEIIKIFLDGYKFLVQINSTNENLISSSSLDNVDGRYEYMFITILLLMVSAFSINFSKSLSTLNSLEFNRLGIKPINQILGQNTKYIYGERIVRTITAFIFIIIEKELYDIEFYQNNSTHIGFTDLQNILINQSILIAVLYLLLLVWFYLILYRHIKNDNEYQTFRKQMPLQFFSGLFISFCFVFISVVSPSNFTELKFWFGLIFVVMLVSYFVFFKSIVIIENSFLKTVKPHYAKH